MALKKLPIRERSIASYFKKQVEKFGGYIVKIKGEGQNGIVDYLVAAKAELFIVETKKPKGGVISPIQEYQARQFGKRGVRTHYIFTKEDADKFVKTYVS